jgi:glyoxylase-like metal-dependent hydrolase (beta-lactamase superfamily II)
MIIHHLNAGTLCPLSHRFAAPGVNHLVCHCLLIETSASGLVLVDTGFGLADVAAPVERLGRMMLLTGGLKLDANECVIRQVERLGFSPSDVRHIILTHLDLDHAGGLPDFPNARVHVLAEELAAATVCKTAMERARYRPGQWAHKPAFELASATGEPWRGFAAARALPGLPPEILMLPLTGHTRGHACVAIETHDGPIVHAGDAYFTHATMRGSGATYGMEFYERLIAIDRTKLEANHERLRELRKDPSVKLFCAHDVSEFEAFIRMETADPVKT